MRPTTENLIPVLTRIAEALEHTRISPSETAFEERSALRETWPLLKSGNLSNEVFHRMCNVLGNAPSPQDVKSVLLQLEFPLWFSLDECAQEIDAGHHLAEAWLYFAEILGVVVTTNKRYRILRDHLYTPLPLTKREKDQDEKCYV